MILQNGSKRQEARRKMQGASYVLRPASCLRLLPKPAHGELDYPQVGQGSARRSPSGSFPSRQRRSRSSISRFGIACASDESGGNQALRSAQISFTSASMGTSSRCDGFSPSNGVRTPASIIARPSATSQARPNPSNSSTNRKRSGEGG